MFIPKCNLAQIVLVLMFSHQIYIATSLEFTSTPIAVLVKKIVALTENVLCEVHFKLNVFSFVFVFRSLQETCTGECCPNCA